MSSQIYFVTFCTWERLILNPEAQGVVMTCCQFFDQRRYQIFAGVIMPDHVHLLIQPWQQNGRLWSIGSILHTIKSYSAKQIPDVMPHIGKVWQDGRHQRLILNQPHFQSAWNYIGQNPVKASFAKSPQSYPFFWESQML